MKLANKKYELINHATLKINCKFKDPFFTLKTPYTLTLKQLKTLIEQLNEAAEIYER